MRSAGAAGAKAEMPRGGFRLPAGGRIDRQRKIRFRYDGRAYTGHGGDTLASALLANGVQLVGRSFKFHRPRGVLSAGSEECNALVRLESGGMAEPNARATMAPLYPDLAAASQNCWPSVRWDLHGLLGMASRLLPAGFYYKTFMWPSWGFWEGLVRRAAGIGKLPETGDPQQYHKRHAHCDVLVVGAGPAGLMATMQAARSGARVLLVDEQEELGGSLLWERDEVDGLPAQEWLARQLRRLTAFENVRCLVRCAASGFYEGNMLVLAERVAEHLGPAAPADMPRQRLWKVRAGQVVLATGALERPLVFPNNDRPGIMLASAVRHYVNRYAVAPGRRTVVATNNDSAYRTALDLHSAGVAVVAVADFRPEAEGDGPARARQAGIEVLAGTQVSNTRGRGGLRAVQLLGAAAEGAPQRWLRCDLLAVSGGWNPAAHLHSQAGGALRFVDEWGSFVPAQRPGIETAGAVNGCISLPNCLRQGLEAGRRAAGNAGFDVAQSEPVPVARPLREGAMMPVWNFPQGPGENQWVDFQHDVTLADVRLSARENFVSVEHFKRYTTTGMSVDQGKTSNVLGLANLAQALGKPIPEVGTTKFRPPYSPVSLGGLAGPDTGARYRPRREMPCHDWHVAQGALMLDAGGWQRPACYPAGGETRAQAMRREALAVRRSVGLFEGSPLGKIEVRGADAAQFLDRIYMNRVASLKPGAIRYALVLHDSGAIADDGLVIRMAEDRFLLSPSSAFADRLFAALEEWHQTLWHRYEVICAPVTTGWATLTLSGPRARTVLQRLDSNLDLSGAAFAHMQFREGLIEGMRCRIARVSFGGDLTYEVSVPAGVGQALWERLLEAGAPEGIAPFGLDALNVLRLEKGYPLIGVDTDANTIPDDIGWGAVARKKNLDYVGRRSLSLPVHAQAGRWQLVGLRLLDGAPGQTIAPGAHCVEPADTAGGLRSVGHVTSSCFSPFLNKPVAIGRLENGRDRRGEAVTVFHDGQRRRAEVVPPVFFDPEGSRLNG